jgi:hypothetical protein
VMARCRAVTAHIETVSLVETIVLLRQRCVPGRRSVR